MITNSVTYIQIDAAVSETAHWLCNVCGRFTAIIGCRFGLTINDPDICYNFEDDI